jgi:hypothetical protein
MAVCGLDCAGCDIRKVPTDPVAAERVMNWFRSMGWLEDHEGLDEVIERRMYCCGCHGDRSTHWSADCWILQCCVDDKRLAFCYECETFPCSRLVEWAAQNARYTEALNRLRSIKEADSDPRTT